VYLHGIGGVNTHDLSFHGVLCVGGQDKSKQRQCNGICGNDTPPHERYRNDEEANGNTQEELASLLPGEEKSCHGLDDRQILEPL
jgi:hypothetical protein